MAASEINGIWRKRESHQRNGIIAVENNEISSAYGNVAAGEMAKANLNGEAWRNQLS
jgi:hypothetical protein